MKLDPLVLLLLSILIWIILWAVIAAMVIGVVKVWNGTDNNKQGKR